MGNRAHQTSRGGPWAWIDDRLNPILVREVRQSLAGRYFRYTFWLTLVTATMVGVVVLANGADAFRDGRSTDEVGIWFFTANYACLAAGVLLFVPFAAFNALGSEWEENTYDLLVLSNLRPARIVLGKLLAAQVQALLFYSAFGPFLIFAFVMRGVDLVAALFACGAIGIFSVLLTVLALALSGVARARFARIAMMAGLTVALVYASIGAAVAGFAVLENPNELRNPGFWQAVGGLATGALLLVSLLFVVACGRLAHVEENRSTGLRIVATLFPLAGLPWGVWLYRSTGREIEALLFVAVVVLAALTLAAAAFATEPERLGRRVRKQVPKHPLLAFLATPFLPGGGRGLLLFTSLLMLLGSALAATLFAAPPALRHLTGMAAAMASAGRATITGADAAWLSLRACAVLCLYAFTYVALPTGVLSFFPAVPRRLAAALVPLLALLAFAIPTVWSLFTDSEPSRFMGTDHLGNPFWIVGDVLDHAGRSTGPSQLTLLLIAAAALVLNLPRIVRGTSEVLQESAERRTASSTPTDPTPTPRTPDAIPES